MTKDVIQMTKRPDTLTLDGIRRAGKNTVASIQTATGMTATSVDGFKRVFMRPMILLWQID